MNRCVKPTLMLCHDNLAIFVMEFFEKPLILWTSCQYMRVWTLRPESVCRNFCLSMTSTRSRWQCEGPCPPSFLASDLQPCRLSASKHNGLQILELDLLHANDLRKIVLDNWLCRSILQQWHKLYQYHQTMLPTGRTCQIGNGERTGTVSCQSTLDGKVSLGQ